MLNLSHFKHPASSSIVPVKHRSWSEIRSAQHTFRVRCLGKVNALPRRTRVRWSSGVQLSGFLKGEQIRCTRLIIEERRNERPDFVSGRSLMEIIYRRSRETMNGKLNKFAGYIFCVNNIIGNLRFSVLFCLFNFQLSAFGDIKCRRNGVQRYRGKFYIPYSIMVF